ncbi:MAG: hypothetical protein CMB83_05560 [Flammeovirgaceae bacterium]|nr:hypothetical protein [Flammeovirgaceae bacterium]|tara:strand:- start:6846 stop:8261 length:1416 start_codon:yes stop_codon:yes gene_type:complete
MFRLEKVLQNDDSAYVIFTQLTKGLGILLSFYIFSILENNSIYELYDAKIFLNSKYFNFSIFLSIIYIFLSLFFVKNKIYKFNFISYLKDDISIIAIANIITFVIYFLIKKTFVIDKSYIYSIFILALNLYIGKKIFNGIYNYMVNNDVIHKNIMLVGNYNDVKYFLKKKKEKINVFKCCILDDLNELNQKIIRNEIRIPLFKKSDDIRSILEYHELGQIWILESDKSKTENLISNIIKFSVDILIVKLHSSPNLDSSELLYDKFEFKKYEISRFHGLNFFIKIVLDKLLSILFLIIAAPILFIASIFIFIEDGFPILFTQNRTGWDGRRFKIYKLRTLKKGSFDKTVQVTFDDKRKLKCGTFLRRFSIDELPQLLNVLFGDMSIVGPRPHMVEHDIKYSKLFNSFLKRHKCSPGLTGWAQVNGLRGATPNPENMRRRMEHDLWYLNNWTIILDIYIIMKTFFIIFKYKGD